MRRGLRVSTLSKHAISDRVQRCTNDEYAGSFLRNAKFGHARPQVCPKILQFRLAAGGVSTDSDWRLQPVARWFNHGKRVQTGDAFQPMNPQQACNTRGLTVNSEVRVGENV